MNPDAILRKEDCEAERTAEELITWFDSVHARFGADDTGKNYARMGKGLSKAFFQELMPLGHLARHKYLGKPHIYFRPKIGNQSYDAEIIDRSTGDVTRVEFTNTCHDGDLALRMEYLAEHGEVPLTGPVWRKGTKASGGQVCVQRECVDHREVLDEMVASVEKAVEDKVKKPYAVGTILAVVVDDYRLNPEDISLIQSRFRNVLTKPMFQKFPTIFIIGASGGIVWEFRETGFLRS